MTGYSDTPPLRSGADGRLLLLGQCIVVVGGTVLLSHATNQVARTYLALPLGAVGGMILAWVISRWRSTWSNRRLDFAAVFYLVALSLVSLTLDWFDPRGVIPAAVLESAALLLPPSPSGRGAAVAHEPRQATINVAAASMMLLAVALLWVVYAPTPDQTL